MRTSIFVVAVIFGCAMCQAPAPTNQNYCNAKGTYCAVCSAQGTNKSCDLCWYDGFATNVAGAPNTNECVRTSIGHCIKPASTKKCDLCRPGYVLDTTMKLCGLPTTTQITDCNYY